LKLNIRLCRRFDSDRFPYYKNFFAILDVRMIVKRRSAGL
jgi:hypothetical protein